MLRRLNVPNLYPLLALALVGLTVSEFPSHNPAQLLAAVQATLLGFVAVPLTSGKTRTRAFECGAMLAGLDS